MELNAIVERAKEKDARAFDILYRAYRPKMVGICMNIIKEDQVVVDDLVHDAFILAFVSIDNLRDNARFGEWLSTIMRNVALKHVEQRDKLRLLPIASVSERETLQMYSVSSPESDLNYKELLGLVNLLPEGYRRILRLSVIEGFSHKEIADMLGIEPHSSSSQLSRAKRMLRRIIESGAVWVLLILFAPIAWAIILKHIEWRKEENVTHVRERHNHLKAESCDSIVEDQDSVQDTMLADSIVVVNVSMPTVVSFDTDSATFILPSAPIEEPVLEEIDGDSLGVNVHNYAPNLLFAPLRNTTEMVRCKDSKWHLRLTGSIGFALTQNSYPLINIDTSLLPGTDSIHSMLSNQVGTWEDYSTYLSYMPSQVDSIRTFVLKEISSHNLGKIVQREYHSSPMTFGLSLARTLGRNWTVETGMQYSLLKSTFTMGEGGYSVVDKQSVHYLGIPVHLSYDWLSYRGLSAYGSVGVTMHIPILGKRDTNYTFDWQTVYTESAHFAPSLQWQVGVGLGVQYRFAPHTSIFAEPTFNWFIPSAGETRTVWTERPVAFMCPFGIRISW